MDEHLTVKEGMEQEWVEVVNNNRDDYGYGVVKATVAVGKALDLGKTCEQSEKEMNGFGITGFMAGCVAQWIAYFHPRGDEFRKWWNVKQQVSHEGEEANKSNGVLNPAILTVGLDSK